MGGTTEVRVDVRFLAATNRDLPAMVAQGLFREDLYYRLITIAVELPPLRARAGDVERLAGHFLARLNGRYGFQKRFGPAALDRLAAHDWPGNVRELLHAVEAAVVVCEGPEVGVEHLPPALRSPIAAAAVPSAPVEALPTLRDLERSHIERALSACGGRRAQAARVLGISERNLYRKLREYGILA